MSLEYTKATWVSLMAGFRKSRVSSAYAVETNRNRQAMERRCRIIVFTEKVDLKPAVKYPLSLIGMQGSLLSLAVSSREPF